MFNISYAKEFIFLLGSQGKVKLEIPSTEETNSAILNGELKEATKLLNEFANKCFPKEENP